VKNSYLFGYLAQYVQYLIRYEQEGISADLASDVALDFVLGQLGHPRYKGPRTSAYKLKGLVRSPYETLF
jgi:hypothetical protein